MTERLEHGAAVDRARKELARRGLPFTEADFLRYVRSGNLDAVDLYLRAGISPNASLDGESALAAAVNHRHEKILHKLLAAGANPTRVTHGLKTSEKKTDHWQRLSSLSGVFTFISSVLIAGVGWYFTNTYNERQLEHSSQVAIQEQQNRRYQNRLLEMQTVEKMIPHLTDSESTKQVALIAISTLASREIAIQIARTYGGQGSIDALEQLAKDESGAGAAPATSALTSIAARESSGFGGAARQALANVLEGTERSVVRLGSEGFTVCNGFVVDRKGGWIVTPKYCVERSEARELTLSFEDGRTARVREIRFGDEGLIALLKSSIPPPPALELGRRPLPAGSSVSQLAFDLTSPQDGPRGIRVVLGTVVAAGRLEFSGFGAETVRAEGLKVKLEADEMLLQGSAGGPLLDSEGKVACMTFQGVRGDEQCIAASVIAKELARRT